MSNITMGVKLDETVRERLKTAAKRIDRTPHWVIKQAIFNYLEQLENNEASLQVSLENASTDNSDDNEELQVESSHEHQPFIDFAEQILPQSVNRAAITAAYRRPEPETVSMLLEQARMAPNMAQSTHQMAFQIAEKLRNRKSASGRAGIVQNLLQEFSLSSQEGVALMCLAEALLRIPDKANRDALIRDKISTGDWNSHLGRSPSLFVNATTWGLLLTGRLVSTHNEGNLTKSLSRIIGKSGEPLIRKSVDMAMRVMGEQFVTGETIADALANARKLEDKGFRYSYDMLGEAALTKRDADAYMQSYQQAIHAIGKASHGRGIYEGPGISIKLSALHPRYSRAQYDRVMEELYPRVLSLTLLARSYDIGINIDAEEADRLEISLDLLERLCFEPELNGWNGIGFVIQAYQKRCPLVVDFLIDLAQRSQHRLMIRLVKGAYWDSEIKRAQIDGLEGYPVYTRKVYTDVCYLACARKLLSATHAIYPQFATHNAHTLAAIYHFAGNNYYPGQYEFQCLHGMGEPLYDQIVGKIADGKYNRPCRIYAPVGTHETLLAYLVRRLLENGANTSFVNRVADNSLPLDELVADPVATTEALAHKEGQVGLPHPKIPEPVHLYGNSRLNSQGMDLSNEQRLASLSSALLNSANTLWQSIPMIDGEPNKTNQPEPVLNPSNHSDIVGYVTQACAEDVELALTQAIHAGEIWFATPPTERAAILERAANILEQQMPTLMGLLVREAGKTFNNAIAEVREAVDFLRYYATQVRQDFSNTSHRPLGPVVCISPWNFPLAIFIGQVSAALATGNTVLAKPAEQTPLVAAQAVKILHEAGVPAGALQLLPGAGETVGAQLVGDERVRGVMFTGSTAVAGLLQRNISGRLDPQGNPTPLIAETGGLNAMIVDSSALTEQVVGDVVASAFDSAGQRCSALRILCIQEEVAEHTLQMLRGAMAQYRMGNPERLVTDIGPVIDAEAKENIEHHIETMRAKGRPIYQATFADETESKNWSKGTFVKPTLIELENFAELEKEIFGPVLHVVRYQRQHLNDLINQINASGYGLTLGVHTRIDEMITRITQHAHVGNQYVNRNIVGAVVGVQPFGGEGLSGTGPKAGGPLYLYRLLSQRPNDAAYRTLSHYNTPDNSLRASFTSAHDALQRWAKQEKQESLLQLSQQYAIWSQSGSTRQLNGPTGENNIYTLLPREYVLCLFDNEQDALTQLAAVLAVGSQALWQASDLQKSLYKRLPTEVQKRIVICKNWADEQTHFDAVIYHGDSDQLRLICEQVAQRPGPIISVQGFARGQTNILLERLLRECSLSINTAAAGGNASLMTIN